MRMLPIPNAEQPGFIACSLIDSIGRADFGNRLLQSLRSTVRPDLISMFLHNGEKPVLLGHGTLARTFDEQRAMRSYMSVYFREDPAKEVISNHLPVGGIAALYMTRTEVPTLSYRRQCYEEARIVDRFTVVRKLSCGEAISVNLYRDARSGPLDDSHLDLALSLSPMLGAAVARHCELTVARDYRDPDRVLLQLIERFPMLTMREAQAAAEAIAGRTAEETADKLGLKASSVVTHRKRAYERLNVAGLRDLMILYSAEG
ncbi:LuxR C-terminal-related transcriptional regulator [Sphingobium sp. EM0848]|uniref:helix-turn-helix transcriptional regulator n=1 Tax=Sphingobium sp. EM0848 TaxID=2743473 RepID=UPI00159C1CD1|nr:LuxR C-terminal-related transcriptional regulator [Sphingobium sp. EM0848]